MYIYMVREETDTRPKVFSSSFLYKLKDRKKIPLFPLPEKVERYRVESGVKSLGEREEAGITEPPEIRGSRDK